MPFKKNDSRINRGGRPVGSKEQRNDRNTKEVFRTHRKQL